MSSTEKPIVFATLDHRAQAGRGFGIRPADLARHVLVLGRTGAGKSVLLEHLLRGQLERGAGLALLDPHGDLCDRVLAQMPRARTNDVLLFDPGDPVALVGLNPLAPTTRHEPALVAAGVLSVFRRLFASGWGPRTEHVLRNALLTELARPEPSLLGCLRLLVDDDYRARRVTALRDPVVKLFWQEFSRWSPSFRGEVLSAPVNKLAGLLADPSVREILGANRSRLRCRTLMDREQVLLANLARGRVGEDASGLFGGILTVLFQLAAYSRADLSPSARRPFTLYLDEFQLFAPAALSELLSEGRKFGLALVLATQSLASLDESLRRSVLGNVGTVIAFRMGPEDAALLAPLFAPDLRAEHLVNLDRHQAALRLCIDGVTSAPFTAVTRPPEPILNKNTAEVLRRVSRERYGRPISLER